MTPLFFPCAPGRSAHYPFERTTLKFGDSLLLSTQSLTRISSCETVGVRNEVEYAAMLRQLLPFIGQALAEAFPLMQGALELTGGEFRVVDAQQPASLHALEEALKFILAVEAHSSDFTRQRHLAIFVAYCVAALVARTLKRFESDNEPAWLALWFMSTQCVRAGFTSQVRHARFVTQMTAAHELERNLPLEVRLGLDGDPLLPTQRVCPPGEEAVLPPIPWAGLLGAEITPLTAYEAARRLGTDLYAERIKKADFCLGRIGFQQVHLAGLNDLTALIDYLEDRLGAHDAIDASLDSGSGRFRSQSLRFTSCERIVHRWRFL